MSLFAELKRRNVFRVGAAYAVISWVLLQVGDTLAPALKLPEWADSLLAFFLLLGFPLALFFAWAYEMTPEGLKKERDVDRAESITHVTGRKLDFTIIAILAIGLVYFIWESRFSEDTTPVTPDRAQHESNVIPEHAQRESGIHTQSSETASASTQDTASEQSNSPPAKSIAVLPFVNMSDDASNEYFSDGISEEILNALAKVKELKVAGRTSSFAFKGQNKDLRLIGQTLGVEHILEGSVRKAGNQVRITAQLIQVKDGFHMWSESYDRELDNVFAIQDEISAAILEQLKAHLMAGVSTSATPVDTQAYELYLLARQRVYDRTAISIGMAIDLLDQALEIDDSYAPAYALKGVATILMAEGNYGELNTRRSKDTSLPLLERALSLDPDLPEALAGMGLWVSQFEKDNRKAVEYHRKALAINPSLTNAGIWYATALAELGETREAIAIGEQLFSRDPLNPTVRNNLAVDYNNTGQPQRVLDMAEQLTPVTPGNLGLNKIIGEAHQALGDYALAYQYLDKALRQEELHGPIRGSFTFVLITLMEWDQVVEQGNDNQKSYGLSYLGRTEEALLLETREVAEEGPSVSYFQLLVENGRHGDLIEYVESRWDDLAGFELENPERAGYGANMMGFIAQSYGLLGNEKKFNDAMARFQASLDAQLEAGNSNGYLSLSRAFHAMLSGDREAAIDFLDFAFTHGITMDPRQRKMWPVFHPLEGEPRYEESRSRMLEHLNAERVKLGLERIVT